MAVVSPEERERIQARKFEIIDRAPQILLHVMQTGTVTDPLWYVAQMSLQPAGIPPWLYQLVPLDGFQQVQDFTWECTPVPPGLHRDPQQQAFADRMHALKLEPTDAGLSEDMIDYSILKHLQQLCTTHENMMWRAIRDSDQPKPIRIQRFGSTQPEHIVWHWNPFGTAGFTEAKDITHICCYPHDQSRARFQGTLMAQPLPPTVLRYPRTTEDAAPITERLACVNQFIDDNGGIQRMRSLWERSALAPGFSVRTGNTYVRYADIRLALTEREILTRWLAVCHGEHARRQRIAVHTHGVLSDEIVDMTASKISFTTADFLGRRLHESIDSAICDPPPPDDPPLG